MKKIFTLLFCLVALSAVMAQTRTVYIYIPGDGEHRGGFSLNPSFGSSAMLAKFNHKLPQFAPRESDLANSLGIGFEGFWGYDTEHGNAVEWSQITAIGARYQPYSGTVEDSLHVSHDVNAAAFAVYLRETPSMIISVSDQFKLGIGLDVVIEYAFNGAVRVDGSKWENAKSNSDGFESFFLGLGGNLAGVLEAKYFFSDQLYAGARLGYKFYTLNIGTLMGNDNNYDEGYCGAVSLNQADQQAQITRFCSTLPFQLGLEIGFRW